MVNRRESGPGLRKKRTPVLYPASDLSRGTESAVVRSFGALRLPQDDMINRVDHGATPTGRESGPGLRKKRTPVLYPASDPISCDPISSCEVLRRASPASG